MAGMAIFVLVTAIGVAFLIWRSTEHSGDSKVLSVEATRARPTSTPIDSAAAFKTYAKLLSGQQTTDSGGLPYKLALISASCTHRTDIGFNECQGFVKNISGGRLENVEVVLEWVDAEGVPQDSDDALIDYNPILPEQQSPWSTIGTYNPALDRFRVRFKDLFGGTILTRDDRQQ